jgi:hypothetical protein
MIDEIRAGQDGENVGATHKAPNGYQVLRELHRQSLRVS